MAAEVVKQLKELRSRREKTESDITGKKAEIRKSKEETKGLKTRRSECLKERKEAEGKAYQTEQDLSALKIQIYGVERDIDTCKIELDELSWDLSRIFFFSMARRKKITEQIKEKKKLVSEHQAKLKELTAKKDELEKMPRYEETIAEHMKIKEKLDIESEEKQAHETLVQGQLTQLQKELSELMEQLNPLEEQIRKMIEEGEMTEDELNAALTEEEKTEEVVPETATENAKESAGEAKQEQELPAQKRMNLVETGALYAPGEEPEEIKEKLSELLEKLEEAYPDHVVVGLHANHKQIGKKVTELYRVLGYDNGNEFLAAYGYTSKRRRPWG